LLWMISDRLCCYKVHFVSYKQIHMTT
jgi:hypothetical protein